MAGSSALQDSSIKQNRDINKFLKNPSQDLTTLEDSVMTSNLLQDKLLNEFPIFPFNEDYLRAIATIVQNKINQLGSMVAQFVAHVDAQARRYLPQ